MKKLTTEEFITKAHLVHGDRYDYSLVNYINNKTKIKIVCLEHGVFEQKPNNHITNKHNCPICSNILLIKHNIGQSSTTEEFKEKAKKVHGDKYDYSLVKYVNKKTKVIILCDTHGVFTQKPMYHLRPCGCPKCNKSKGETLIEKLLNDNKINYIPQKTFDDCKLTNKLPFDFYLPDYNILIEYDGEQHFKPIKIFGGEIRYMKQKQTDMIKNEFCLLKNIKLVRIKYSDNINDIFSIFI